MLCFVVYFCNGWFLVHYYIKHTSFISCSISCLDTLHHQCFGGCFHDGRTNLFSVLYNVRVKDGLVIYLHDSWNFKIVHSNKNSQIWESLIIEISNPCNGSAPTIILSNIHRPTKSGKKERDTFNTEFNQVLLDLQSNTHMVYVTGDFNINLFAVNDTQFNYSD